MLDVQRAADARGNTLLDRSGAEASVTSGHRPEGPTLAGAAAGAPWPEMGRPDDTALLRRDATERERLAERISRRMDGPVTVLGVVFLFVVLVETVSNPGEPIATALRVAGWALWAVFAAEFVLRMVIAPSTWGFLRRNWWQLLFLILPFLRFARILARLRLARMGRVLSSAVRTGRSAGRRLSNRLGWLVAVTVIVVLASSQLLFEFAGYDSYGAALHAAALATITGQAFGRDSAVAQLLEVVLAVYSVVVFAALAGMLGAYFVERPVPGEADREPGGR
jgi:voltage-gated potassium channel